MPQSVEDQETNRPVLLPRLLRTKLLVPQSHPELVPRPRLLARLDGGLRCPVIVLSASAGFGKTTLLTTWLASRDLDVAWVSLDERDNDPTRFWSYVIAALETRWPEVGETANAMLHTPQTPPIEGVLTELLNDVADQEGPCVLVLDDYHAIIDEAIHQGVAYLVEHVPPQLRLVLSSRTDPALPLSLLRARRQLVELRSADLRFTSDETLAFLNEVMGLALADNEIAELETQVEGWAAGLQLAALSLRESADVRAFLASFSGSHRYVFDYLAHEIFHRQPEDLQRFLLRTAPLDRLNRELCDVVTGFQESQRFLEALERANLFIVPLDRERRWYRYHHLFADFLRALMADQLPPEEVCALHRRASRWYAARGEYHDAIHHALAAEDLDEATSLVRQAAPDQFLSSELKTFLDWLGALPADLVAQDAYLSTAGAWAALALGQNDAAASYVEAVERLVGRSDAPEAGLGELSVIRASLAFNQLDFERAKELSLQAQVALAKGGDGIFNDRVSVMGISAFNLALASEFSGETDAAISAFERANTLLRQDANSHVLPMSISHLAQLQMQRGQLRAAAETYEMACESVDVGPARSPLGGLAFTGMGTLRYEWNDLDAAESYLRQGLALGQQWAEWEILFAGYAGLVRIALARGDIPQARDALAACAAEAERMAVAWTRALVQSVRVLVALHVGELATAQAWATGVGQLEAGPIPYHQESDALLLARVTLALGHFDRALGLVSHLLPTVREGGRYGRVIETRILEACALEGLGNRAAALDALTEALQLAEPEGYVRTFLDVGAPLFELLRAVEGAPVRTYASRLLTAAGEPLQVQAGAVPAPVPRDRTGVPAGTRALTDPLSDRELEVLSLMAQGLTNQAIADALFISINTVKTHARHIYEKLEVRNRAQAARRATELHLLG